MTQQLLAVLNLRRGDDARAGPDRIRLLAAIARHGSIAAAGRSVGLSYRAAWNAVFSLNNLFDRPLVESQAGGISGGGATVTEAGLAVIAAFDTLQRTLDDVLADLDRAVSAREPAPFWRLGLKTSARNALSGVVETVTEGAVNAEVVLRLAPATVVTSVITRESVRELDLAPGREALALIKSSFIILAPADQTLRTSARNQLTGVVVRHEVGAVNDEVVLELEPGKTLTATITRGSGEALGFKVGERAIALIKASHVILAVA